MYRVTWIVAWILGRISKYHRHVNILNKFISVCNDNKKCLPHKYWAYIWNKLRNNHFIYGKDTVYIIHARITLFLTPCEYNYWKFSTIEYDGSHGLWPLCWVSDSHWKKYPSHIDPPRWVKRLCRYSTHLGGSSLFSAIRVGHLWPTKPGQLVKSTDFATNVWLTLLLYN